VLALELELLGAALEPPEAEPDFEASLDPDPLIPADELDELGLDAEPGVDGVAEAPPVPPTEAEPDDELGELDGDVLLGEDALELDEPGAEAPLDASRSHAARPKASATAAARIESFMCPPSG
jgi:hypothetical protein